ncbi:MAG: phage holin family protein [Calothrix sp. MO_192.B10]|nr:phage holin family protein [Calothrix sp. MO_192.B10]
MNNIVALLITWVITAVSLYIISKLPLGVEIDSPGKAFISAAVLGIVTAIIRPFLRLFFVVPNFLTFDLFSSLFTFIITVICFGLAAWLVQGFRLRFGIWSAIMGAFALSLISSLMYKVLESVA